MLNKSYKTVWNKTTRTYAAASEVTKSRGAKGASVRGSLVAASAGLLGALAFSQPAAAAECASSEPDCLSVAQALAQVAASSAASVPPAADDAAKPADLAAALDNARVFTGNPALDAAAAPVTVSSNRAGLLGATVPTPVTDYIAVSPNVVQGTRTSASTDLNAMAIGPTAAASGFNALAVGSASIAGSDASTAVGSAAGVGSVNSTAVGAGAMVVALSNNSVAVGYNSRSAAMNTISLGSFASAASSGSVAIGYNSFINPGAKGAVVIGANASASGTGSVALGSDSIADRVNVLSVGNLTQGRQITYVAAGTRPTDAANVGQLSGVAEALGGGALIDPNGAVVAPAYTVGGTTYHDVGAALAAVVSGSAAGSADALRYDTPAHDVATLGNKVTPVKLTNVADATLSAASSDAVTGAQLYGTNQAVGKNTADITNITNNVNNISNGKAGLVQQDAVTHDLTVAKGTDGKHVDFTGLTGSRELVGVAAGTAAGSAVNLAQLSPVVAALGGGATVNANGSVAGPTYHVQAGTQTTVGNALSSLDTGLSSLQSQISGGTVGLVTQNAASHDILIGASTTGTRISVAGTGGNRVIGGLTAGAVGAASSEAINGAQLYANTAGTAAALGGGSTVNADGSLKRPAYSIGGSTYSDVGSALAAAVTTSVQAGANSVQYDSAAHDIITLGNGAAPVRLTNVRAANLAADSTDAVNGQQLFATNQAVAQNTGSITNLDQRVTDNTTNISSLDQRVTDNTTNISHLDQRTTTIEGDVTNITNQITNGEIGLVQQDQASRNLTVAKGTDGARVDFTGTGGARELTGIAAGTTDASAVNLAQFKPMVAALGGGAQINADGSLTGPSYHMQGGTQTTVGDALGSLDNGLSTLQQNMENGGIGMVTQDPVSRVISVGATTNGNLINMAGTAGNRVVTGVAPGAVSSTSSDAVNGSQLHAQAASTAVALGGGATVNADGSMTAPSYSVGGTVVNNVGSAITNLDGRVTRNSSDIAGLQTTIGNLNGAVANAVQYDGSAHDRITLGGTAANAPKVQLTNLKDANLSATSTDAVTGAQLWNTNQDVSTLNQLVQTVRNNQTTGTPYVSVNSSGNAAQAIGNGSVAIGGGAKASAPNSVAIGEGSVADVTNTVSVGSSGSERRITNVAPGQAPTDAVNMQQFQGGLSDMARNAYSGTASALALTAIPEVDSSKNLAIGVGTAGYKGYQAVAVGLSARVTQSLKVKLGAGISSATTAVTAGAAYQW
ncbi:coiled stalk of trimeric autotransporter adhesin family protein [Paraburkholderia xenovorans LB400]|uniref:Hemagluttinin like protein n=1 Tax=Paraburkholderia xenovorans (strain LB400) TaxID=266265 RepID=Q13QC4_PARXL|nr:YadA-like family protein [Paraburkholderia xenovorans]ABE33715.1 hemagluttinin like protein [Paraburkholderia xenovorans LB400]AIP35647.1 coiled stalk of trimeric autotransporter adhesin family protein [Paraburkholderia xenovorans LB400]